MNPTATHLRAVEPSRLRARALAERDVLAARYPDLFRPAWRDRIVTGTVVSGLLGLLVFGFWHLGFSASRFVAGLTQLGTFTAMMLPPVPTSLAKAVLYLNALGETVAIAFLGTLLGAVLAFPLGLLAARNATVNGVVRFFARRTSDTIRGVDQLIWALIWVTVVGLGPFAGVLAVMTSDVGNFSKLFSEAIEAADRKAPEGVAASGGGRLHTIRFGILPQVMPVLAGQVLYFFESNTRSATIIGIVGAGGIGLHLAEQIRTLEWQATAFIILLILVAVAVIDAVSERLRRAIAG